MPPTALNSGEYVELLLGRIAAPYFDIDDFDDLPTPFRTVAVDLLSAQPVVMRRGSLADAMRATMSLPLIFPPTYVDGQVLIDGGTMDNVPADVVKAMGAEPRHRRQRRRPVRIAKSVSYTMLGVAGNTLDAMMRASTRARHHRADVVIDVPLEEYGSLDWRRAAELIDEGYRAAEAMRDQLLPFAVSEAEFEAWRRSRQARRLKDLPTPTFVDTEGFASQRHQASRMRSSRATSACRSISRRSKRTSPIVAGLDRYETVTWRMVRDPSARVSGCVCTAGPRPMRRRS